jgi:folate-dependent phosphoribosylglycinamide formyltransferase PurN
LETLAQKVHAAEHALLPDVVARIAAHGVAALLPRRR